MMPKSIKPKTLYKRLKEIHNIMDIVENRCLAVDGPVSNFQHEVTTEELTRIYELSDVEEYKVVE